MHKYVVKIEKETHYLNPCTLVAKMFSFCFLSQLCDYRTLWRMYGINILEFFQLYRLFLELFLEWNNNYSDTLHFRKGEWGKGSPFLWFGSPWLQIRNVNIFFYTYRGCFVKFEPECVAIYRYINICVECFKMNPKNIGWVLCGE